MSNDHATRLALMRHSQKELRYFELVALRFKGKIDQIFLCIGNHALYLVKRSLSGMYPGNNGGEIFFAYIDMVVEDEQSGTDLLIIMNDNRPSQWYSEKLFIISENRGTLLDHLTVAWQSDRAWRKREIVSLPRRTQPLRKHPVPGLLHATPFKGWQKAEVHGYSAFLPGSYKTSRLQTGNVHTFVDPARELEISIRVEEPEPISSLHREHVRWVAMEYRQAVTETLSAVLILRNAFYLKRMNLANDIACWTSWEVFLKSDSCAIMAIFMRRQYIPPMLDVAQDMAVILTCPIHILVDVVMREEEIMREARTVADSLTPIVRDCTQIQTLYRDMIQAKLESLLFDEDAIEWLQRAFALDESRKIDGKQRNEKHEQLGLRRPKVEHEAALFLKAILIVFQEENALDNPAVLNSLPDGVLTRPMAVKELVMERGQAMLEGTASGSERTAAMNAWLKRVAHYFALCIDGLLLGKQFTFCDLTSASLRAENSRQKVNEAILFMLHARPKDMTQPFVMTSIRHLLHEPSFFHEYTFNERVMQSLLELGWIAQSITVSGEEVNPRAMSLEYAKVLARLLIEPTCKASLKAAICRQIIQCQGSQLHFTVLLPAVMETLGQPSIYLRTYATVTLVNLCRGNEVVKIAIMKDRIGLACMDNLRLQDDDLTLYTLILLNNLTKHVHHRASLRRDDENFAETMATLLRSSERAPSKQKILAEVASVIGQLCADEEMWNTFCRGTPSVVDTLVDVHNEAQRGSKVKANVMFALKQVCLRPVAPTGTSKEAIGPKVIVKLVDELRLAADPTQQATLDHDCVTNAVLLLEVLSVVRRNCELMVHARLVETLRSIMNSSLYRPEAVEQDGGVEPLPDATCEHLSKLWQSLDGKFTSVDTPSPLPVSHVEHRSSLRRLSSRLSSKGIP